jgi:predicted XRE-type DNA-binding protein
MSQIKVVRKTQKQVCIENIEEILKLIAENNSYKEIAKKFGVDQSDLSEVVNSEQYRAQKDLALEIASDKQIEIARSHLESIKEDDTNASVRKKSELSQFELYLAKVKCRKKYDLNYREEKQESNQQILVIPSAEALQLIKVNKDNNLDKQPLENINE